MTIYRARKRLFQGASLPIVEKGTLIYGLTWAGKTEALLQARAIQEISAPPLASLPLWDKLSEDNDLPSFNIHTLADFLEQDPEMLAAILSIDKEETQQWINKAIALLSPTNP